MTPRTTATLVVLATSMIACRSRADQSRAPNERASAATTPPAQQATAIAQPQDTVFRGTMAPVQRVRSVPPGAVRPVLRTAQAAPGPGSGYDRVVFEFTGDSVPGYRVEYTTKPVQRCGSGDPVTVAGTGRMVVRFEPAQAHDEQGNALPAERHAAPRLAAVRELTLVCDFEGQVEWVLGVAVPSPYRVLELTGPARLVLDVRHGR